MHIAYLHYLYGRDTALHHVRQFAEAARGLGHRVDVHAMNLAPPPGSAAGGARRPSLKLRLRQGLKKRFSRYLHDPKELLWNWTYLRKEADLLGRDPPQALLVRSQGLAISCVEVARHFGIPLILEINAPSSEVFEYLDQYRHLVRARRWTARYKLRHAHGLVVVSQALKDYYVETHGLDPRHVTVANNGADLKIFRPDVPPDADFPNDPARPRIGYVGSFQKWHDLDLMAHMIGQVAEARRQSRFLMVGSGPGVHDIRRALPHLPDERLAFTGRVDHARVPGLVSSLDIGVLAQAADYQCPLKVVEWMAMGLAVVAPDHPPLRELIEPEVQGLLFRPGDPDALRDAVLRLVDDPELRLRLGRAAARRAHGEMGWSDNARKVIGACARAKDRLEHAKRRGAT